MSYCKISLLNYNTGHCISVVYNMSEQLYHTCILVEILLYESQNPWSVHYGFWGKSVQWPLVLFMNKKPFNYSKDFLFSLLFCEPWYRIKSSSYSLDLSCQHNIPVSIFTCHQYTHSELSTNISFWLWSTTVCLSIHILKSTIYFITNYFLYITIKA